jgi:transposase
LQEDAAYIFERGGKLAPAVDEDTVPSLHAKIGSLTVANDFFLPTLKPWIGK